MFTTSNQHLSEDRIAVFVASCDAYSDLWPPFFNLFDKYWPDCRFRKYLLCNEKVPRLKDVIPLNIGTDVDWTSNVKKGLGGVEEEFVIFFVEDLFLTAKVDTGSLVQAVQVFQALGGNSLKLVPTVQADRRCNEFFGESSAGSPYRVSTVATVWRKSALLDILLEGENAWQFEVFGTQRAVGYSGFYCAHRAHFRLYNAVIKGRFRRHALARVQRLVGERIESARETLSWKNDFFYQLKVWRFNLLMSLPFSLGTRLRRLCDRDQKYRTSKNG